MRQQGNPNELPVSPTILQNAQQGTIPAKHISQEIPDVPLKDSAPSSPDEPGNIVAGQEGKDMVWVLIVDDDAAIRQSLEVVIHDAGYALVEVGDGEDALDVLRVTPYHAVVLLDLWMPGMDGRSVLDELEHEPELVRRHAWIVMSADHEALRRIPAEQQAKFALTLVEKPFVVDDLLTTVAQMAARLPADD
jgi:CheY-like chemotaxis protein